MPKKALGKGLETLFPHRQEKGESREILDIPVEDIFPNIDQPRLNFDEDKLSDLVQSIKIHGVLQPIFVKKHLKGYEIIAGERRWRATKLAKLESVPCIIKEISEDKKLEISLIENIQREDLNPLEIAEAYDKLLKKFGYNQQELALKMGKDRTTVTNIVRLLKLPSEIKDLIRQEKLSMGHARSILSLGDEKIMIFTAHQVVEKKYSVRETENLIRKLLIKKQEESKKEGIKTIIEKKLEDFLDLKNELSNIFGTKVDINNKNGKGKIEIRYYTKEEFERIIDLLRSSN